jgi:hypothetical protein
MLPVAAIEGDVLALVAARLGTTRLIDNTLIQELGDASPSATQAPARTSQADTHSQRAPQEVVHR